MTLDTAARQRLIEDFGRYVYGVTPQLDVEVSHKIASHQAVFGAGSKSRIEVTVHGPGGSYSFELLACLPNTDESPVLLGLNFAGNDAVLTDWPMDLLLRRGYGVASAHASAIEPDRADGPTQGIRTVLGEGLDDWGTLGVWAWALSRLRMVISDLAHVRSDRIVAVGHSRMGKAALWAGAQDEAFAAVISNEAGCSGDSLHRHRAGEDIAAITSKFPYWFTPAYADYAGRDEELPVDQDQLLASLAPRPVCVGSASENDWADPVGQFQAVMSARRLNRGTGPIGFHLRPGDHALITEDWMHYIDFLDCHLG